MSANKLQILARQRERMGSLTALGDFEWRAGGQIEAAQLLEDPNASLYCLDPKRQQVIFTILPPGIDLTQAAFVYQAQFDYAECLVAMPCREFLRLAQGIPFDAARVLCLHNIGRCGSTVMSRALNEIDGLAAFSEPDVLTNFIALPPGASSQRLDLLRACFRWLCRPAVAGAAQRFVIKFRNQSAPLMDLYIAALPAAAHLFMYRNVLDWLASFHRLQLRHPRPARRFTRRQAIAQQADYYQRPRAEVAGFFDPAIESYAVLESRAVGWLLSLQHYLDVHRQGADLAAIRYEDLLGRRDALLARVIEGLGLPAAAVAATRPAFARDSQAGTKLARAAAQQGNTIALPAAQQATVRRLLQRQPRIKHPDFVLPGTLLHSGG